MIPNLILFLLFPIIFWHRSGPGWPSPEPADGNTNNHPGHLPLALAAAFVEHHHCFPLRLLDRCSSLEYQKSRFEPLIIRGVCCGNAVSHAHAVPFSAIVISLEGFEVRTTKGANEARASKWPLRPSLPREIRCALFFAIVFKWDFSGTNLEARATLEPMKVRINCLNNLQAFSNAQRQLNCSVKGASV